MTHTCEWDMTHTCEWAMTHTCEWAMTHTCLSEDALVMESRCTLNCVTTHLGVDTWLSRVTHIGRHARRQGNAYGGESGWVMSHIWMSHVTHMIKSCHTHEWVSSHVRVDTPDDNATPTVTVDHCDCEWLCTTVSVAGTTCPIVVLWVI